MNRNPLVMLSVLLLVAVSIFLGCGSDSKSTTPQNSDPTILSVTAEPDTLYSIDLPASVAVTCNANDDDGDELSYSWSATQGTLSGSGSVVTWSAAAGQAAGDYSIVVEVSDDGDSSAVDSVSVVIIASPPEITSFTADTRVMKPGDEAVITVATNAVNPGELTYTWTTTGGTLAGTGATATWTAPDSDGNYQVSVSVANNKDGAVADTLRFCCLSGTFLARTNNGVIAVGADGDKFIFGDNGSNVELIGTRIFLGNSSVMTEYSHTGEVVGGLDIPSEVFGYITMLPDGGAAAITNSTDLIQIVNTSGELMQTIPMSDEPNSSLQMICGLVVGNNLIVSEDGFGFSGTG